MKSHRLVELFVQDMAMNRTWDMIGNQIDVHIPDTIASAVIEQSSIQVQLGSEIYC
jgi:hypothetical protein